MSLELTPSRYRKAAHRLAVLAARLEAAADAATPREKAARTRLVNLLAQEARRLFTLNAPAGPAGEREAAK